MNSPFTGEDDLRDVKRALTTLNARWKDIGIGVGLKSGQLNNLGNPDECLFHVITNWLKRNYNTEKFGPPTWRRLVEVVADESGGNDRALAGKIAREHPTEIKDGESCFDKPL